MLVNEVHSDVHSAKDSIHKLTLSRRYMIEYHIGSVCSDFGHLISCYGRYTTFISPARLWPVSTETTSTMMSSQ